MDVGLRQDPLGQPVPDGRQAQGAADIERQVAELVAEAEKGFHGGEGAVAAGGGQIAERIGKALEVGEGDGGERLPCPAAEAFDIGAVGALGMRRPAVKPDFKQLVVGIGLDGGDRGAGGG